jgi:tripartite-type tricarboxylate transporter receptor subunit TctC
MMHSPALKKRLVNLGIQPWPGSPEEFANLVRTARERFAQLINAAGIRKR